MTQDPTRMDWCNYGGQLPEATRDHHAYMGLYTVLSEQMVENMEALLGRGIHQLPPRIQSQCGYALKKLIAAYMRAIKHVEDPTRKFTGLPPKELDE